MEATGVYWKPVWHVLEAVPGIELLLANAHAVKNHPLRRDGRGVSGSAELASC